MSEGKQIRSADNERIDEKRPEDALKSLLYERVAWLMTPRSRVEADTADSECIGPVRDAIIDVAETLTRHGWSAYLVGGTLRDLVVGSQSGYPFVAPRDVDIVVCGAGREELRHVLEKKLVVERLTRFGGLHLMKPLPSGHRLLLDVWTLADTWGFGAQKIPPRIEDFPATTFLNIDSCVIELIEQGGRPRACFDHGFFSSVADRVLDINYEPNPYPYVCVARALVMAVRLDFAITHRLAEFVLRQTAAGGIEALIEAQVSHYGFVRSGEPELSLWIDGIRRAAMPGRGEIRIEASADRRRQLWQDYPAASHSSHTG